MPIDDTKKCICKPSLSGKNKSCPRCNPDKKVVVIVAKKDIKPAQVKKHKATPTGQLPWLHTDPDDHLSDLN